MRGTKGEWSDTQLLYLDEEKQPRRRALLPTVTKPYACLDTQLLRDKRRNWTAELAPDTVQDEFAIASLLLDMGACLNGGPSPYPLDFEMTVSAQAVRTRYLRKKPDRINQTRLQIMMQYDQEHYQENLRLEVSALLFILAEV